MPTILPFTSAIATHWQTLVNCGNPDYLSVATTDGGHAASVPFPTVSAESPRIQAVRLGAFCRFRIQSYRWN